MAIVYVLYTLVLIYLGFLSFRLYKASQEQMK